MKKIAVACLTTGLLVAGYLTLRSLALAEGTRSTDVCSVVFGRGCDATLAAPFSKQLGVPLAGWGVVYFSVVLLLLLLGRTLGEGFRPAAAAAASLVALAGSLGSLLLLGSLIAGAFPFCPACVVANGLNLLALVPVLRWSGRPLREQVRAWTAGLRYAVGGKVVDPVAARWRVLAFLFVALAGAAIYQWVLIETARRESSRRSFDPEKVLSDYEAAPVVEVPVRPDDPTIGPTDARARLVVFSDAFCPFCRMFWSGINRLLAPYGDDVQVVYKHFPLESVCNPSAKATLHPMACLAGVALEAARKEGVFWGYQDALRSPRVRAQRDPFGHEAEKLGLDRARFLEEMRDPGARARMDADIALGRKLGVTATPTIYLNGRKLRDHDPRAIRLLIDHVLGGR